MEISVRVISPYVQREGRGRIKDEKEYFEEMMR